MGQLDLEKLNRQFEAQEPTEILAWAWQTFGQDLAATSSFQTQSVALLHLISETCPELPILFLDTGFHFPETLAYRDQLIRVFGLNVKNITPLMGHSQFRIQHGLLHQNNPDLCCFINKVEPLEKAKKAYGAWISGIRRDQTAHRANTPIISIDKKGRYKICPMANWDKRKLWRHIGQYQLPEHPLLDQGYLSVGCAPCTRALNPGEDERAGRWAGQEKTECGLHVDVDQQKKALNRR